MEDELAVGGHLDEPGQLGLVGGRVDHGVLVVVEEPEEAVEVDVHGGGLDHLRVPRLQADAAGGDVRADV
jgi:hypothetical protein